MVVTETYPRAYYCHIRPLGAPVTQWSKRRRADQLAWTPGLLHWAAALGVRWHPDILSRAEEGFSAGPNGEDEFDAMTGQLAMIAAVNRHHPRRRTSRRSSDHHHRRMDPRPQPAGLQHAELHRTHHSPESVRTAP